MFVSNSKLKPIVAKKKKKKTIRVCFVFGFYFFSLTIKQRCISSFYNSLFHLIRFKLFHLTIQHVGEMIKVSLSLTSDLN